MDIRIFTEPQQGASYDDLLRVAKAAEDLGFDAFFRSDHYLSMGSASGLPGPSDAWISLAGLARDTSRIKLGTLVSPVTFRGPGSLAISVAQVDQMSGGRAELGLGTGWFSAEHTAYGLPFPELGDRFSMLEEQVEIVDGLWRTGVGERYSFTGRHYSLAESPALPKPAQQPRPPIILGGSGLPRSARLAARYADEYNAAFKLADTADIFDRVREASAETGRELTYSVALVLCAGRDDTEFYRRAEAIGRDPAELRREGFAGSPADVVDRIGHLSQLGATRIYLQVLDLADIDHLELFAAEVVPQL
jgi:F420-dependent oxidoreductase-like protein